MFRASVLAIRVNGWRFVGSAALPTAGMNVTRPKKNIRLHSAAASAVTHPSVASVALAPVVTKAG